MENARGLTIPWSNEFNQAELFGSNNRNINFIEKKLGVTVRAYPDCISIEGKEAKKAFSLLDALIFQVKNGHAIEESTVEYYYNLINDGAQIKESLDDIICHTYRGKPIKSKTYGQLSYINMAKKSEITFCIGPAGTGKTYLAMAMAVNALKNDEVNRIVLVRPAVEAGERLGFLPGDMKEKVDPYLRPLYDALYDIIGAETCERYIAKGTIEIAPLAYMRGRTLDKSFIILDEAQNTTPEQMKMFLTRLGFDSKAIITGDITQIDLPFKENSSLKEVKNILDNIKGISFAYLTQNDVVRNPIVQRIINAYEKYEK